MSKNGRELPPGSPSQRHPPTRRHTWSHRGTRRLRPFLTVAVWRLGRMARDIMAKLTHTPCSYSQVAQGSARDLSGAIRNCAARAGRWAVPIQDRRQGRGIGVRGTAFRPRRFQDLIAVSPTPKRRRSSAHGKPTSIAPGSRYRLPGAISSASRSNAYVGPRTTSIDSPRVVTAIV